MDFSRLECRDMLSNINKVNVDPDVLAKLITGANTSTNGSIYAPPGAVQVVQAVLDSPFVPVYVPVGYTDAQLAKIQVPDGNGTRPATQADVDEINKLKRDAHEREWTLRATYKANLNERDVVNAAFDAPERPSGFTPQFERVAVGEKNAAGDMCAAHDQTDGESIFRCNNGHGYKQSRSLRSCPQCFLAGGSAEREEDPGMVAGAEGRW